MSDADGSPPSLLILFGPPAVGKATVGQELEQITGFRLFHLHQVVDLITAYFPYSELPNSSYQRLVASYRTHFFEEAARGGLRVITTSGWRRDSLEGQAILGGYVRPFLECGGHAYLVELYASLDTRMARNQTENRRRLKQVSWSTAEYLRRDDELHRDGSETMPFDLPLLRIETDDLSAEATAERICAHFGLPRLDAGTIESR
jgi:shikimate kinase